MEGPTYVSKSLTLRKMEKNKCVKRLRNEEVVKKDERNKKSATDNSKIEGELGYILRENGLYLQVEGGQRREEKNKYGGCFNK